jgi:ligand-binding SRPBCC domain-containing protein
MGKKTMNEVAAELLVDIRPEDAWERLRDLGKAHLYVPGIIDTKITTEQTEGVGASRQVFSKPRPPMDETVVAWEEGKAIELKLHFGDNDAQGPFAQSFFRYSIEAQGEKTLVRNSMRYTMRWGIVGQLLELLLKRAFQNAVSDVVLAQKLYYETGEPVSREQLKAARN